MLLVASPAGAAAPSAPSAPSLTAGGQQLTATWSAPSGTIDDYDVRWRATGTTNWSGHPEGGYHKTHTTFGSGTGNDVVGGNDPLDLGTVGLSVVSRESVGGRDGVYKINNAVDSMRIRFENYSYTDMRNAATVPTLTLRAASTKPTSSNLRTHGTALATVQPGKVQHPQWWIDFTTTAQLSAGAYFWFESDINIDFGNRMFELSNIDLATTALTKTITGLTDGTTYEVQVRAGNTDGESPWSASATETAGSVPSTPGAPTVASKNASLAVSWTAPAANDPGGITDYDMQYRACTNASDLTCANNPTWSVWTARTGETATDTSTAATISGLTNGTTYEVQVRAANAVGEGEWSASTSTRPGLPDPPEAPTVTPGIYSLAVSWAAPAANGTDIDDYDVQYSSDGGTTWTEWNASATSTATSASITGLTQDTAYLVQVRAASSAGDGPWSPSASTRTRVRTPSAPAAPTVVSGDSTLTAAWSAPADNGFSIVDYDVRYCSSGCTTDSNWTVLLDEQTSDPGATSSDYSDGPQLDPLDLGSVGFTSVTVTRENASPQNPGLYKLGSNVAGLRVKVIGTQGGPHAPATIRARHDASKPATNLTTEGTEIWSTQPSSGSFSGDGWSLPLPANSYFWVASDRQKLHWSADGYFQIRVASTATSRAVSGLTNGTAYQVQVRAANVKGYSLWSPSATIVAGLPGAGAAPRLEAGVGQVRVNWDAPADNGSDITDYDVQYRQGAAGAWTDVSHSGTGRTATISSLTDGQSYQVRVRATNAPGTGPWSPHASVTVGVPAPPDAPTLASGNGTLTVTWTAPASNGSDITDYDVQYRSCTANCAGSSPTWGAWADRAGEGTADTGTTATLSLTNGTAYQVQVRASNARGAGAWSPPATDIPGRPQQSGAPTLTTPNERRIAAAWNATAANGLSVTDYDVQYRLASSDTWIDSAHTGTGLTATIGSSTTPLAPNTSYQVRVRASSSAGPGPWSSAASTTTLTSAPEAPAAPQLSAGATSLTADWTAPTDNGSSITGYSVQYRQSGVSTWTAWSHSGTGTSATITGLTTNQAYEVQVQAANARGSSPWSATASALTGAPAQVGTPTLTATVGQLAVGWTAPNNNGAAIDDYDVHHRRAGASEWIISDGGSHRRRYTDPSAPDYTETVDGPAGNPLDNGTVPLASITRESVGANAGVYKINSDLDELVFYFSGTETISQSTTLRLRHSATKPTAANLSTLGTVLASQTHSTAGLKTFTISTTTAPLSANSWFWLESDNSMTFGSRVFNLDADLKLTGTSHAVTGLTDGLAYEVQVRAGNSRGSGSWSSSVQATMPSAPSAPAAPALTPGDKSLGVTWSSPADNGATITDFDVRYSSDSGATWTEWKPSTTSASTSDTITGLTNGTAYQVQVRAGNAAGDSAWSATATAAPRASTVRLPAPGVPGAITAVRTAGSAAVSWTSPGGSYLRYQMMYREVTGDTWVPNPSYSSSGWVSVTGTQSATQATITSWDDTKTYVVAVRARSHVTGLYGGWGVSDLLAPVGTPPRVGHIELTRLFSGGTLRATWDKLSDSSVASYEAAWSEDTSPRSWSNTLSALAANCTATCTQPFLVNASKDFVVRVRSVSSANKASHWVVSSPSVPLDIENLSATRLLAGTDPSYVEQRPLDVVATWDPVSAAANVSYRVRMQYRVGNPASYYDDTDTNTTVDAKPDHWDMDWEWYSLCSDADSSTNPPGSRGCKDPFRGTAPYLKPVWEFGSPEWGAPQTVNATSCASTCSHTFADATVGGMAVKVQVWAVDSNSVAGPKATFTTHPKRPPGAPLSVTAVAPSGASVQAGWDQAYDRGSRVIGFDVRLLRCTVTPNACVVAQTVTGTKGTPVPDANRDPRAKPRLTYTFHGVATDKLYKVMVRAQNIEGYSDWTVMRHEVALSPTKPPAPAPPTVTISGTTATVTWMAPADDGGSALTGYLVQYRKKGAGGIWSDTWTDHTYSGAVCSGTASCSTTVTVDAGSTVSDYQFRVAATNSITTGSDQYSSVGAPGAPTGVAATATAGGVSVTWTQPADIGTSAIVAADIRTRTSSPQGTWSDPQTPATGPSTSPAAITGLTAGTAYDVQIRVRNANGAGPWVAAGTVTPS